AARRARGARACRAPSRSQRPTPAPRPPHRGWETHAPAASTSFARDRGRVLCPPQRGGTGDALRASASPRPKARAALCGSDGAHARLNSAGGELGDLARPRSRGEIGVPGSEGRVTPTCEDQVLVTT